MLACASRAAEASKAVATHVSSRVRVAGSALPWQVVDMAGLSRAERMAFYINIYNQLIVRALAPLHEARVCACALNLRANMHAHVCTCALGLHDNLHARLRAAPRGSVDSRMGWPGRCMAWYYLDRLRALSNGCIGACA